MKIRVVVTGRGYHTAQQLPNEIDLVDAATVDDAIQLIANKLPDGQQLPASCLIAVSGDHLGTISHHQNRQLSDGDELTLISPVAGG